MFPGSRSIGASDRQTQAAPDAQAASAPLTFFQSVCPRNKSQRPWAPPRRRSNSDCVQSRRSTFAPSAGFFSPAGKISRQSGSSFRSARASAAASSFSSSKAYQRFLFPRRRRIRGMNSPLRSVIPRPIKAVRMPMLHRANTAPIRRPAGVTGDRSP